MVNYWIYVCHSCPMKCRVGLDQDHRIPQCCVFLLGKYVPWELIASREEKEGA